MNRTGSHRRDTAARLPARRRQRCPAQALLQSRKQVDRTQSHRRDTAAHLPARRHRRCPARARASAGGAAWARWSVRGPPASASPWNLSWPWRAAPASGSAALRSRRWAAWQSRAAFHAHPDILHGNGERADGSRESPVFAGSSCKWCLGLWIAPTAVTMRLHGLKEDIEHFQRCLLAHLGILVRLHHSTDTLPSLPSAAQSMR